MRVSLISKSYDAVYIKEQQLSIPLFLERVSAGFPSPAQDYIEQKLDLNELCIQHPAATFFVRVEGESMCEAGIYPGDILVVDRSIQAEHGDIVIAGLHGEFTVKELELRPVVRLVPRNKAYQPIEITEGSDLDIFGVVTNVIRHIRRKSSAKMSKVFALVDCNNLYASCEKLFRPDLRDTPILVLSNNDGCVVARSKKAKKLDIKMGVPVFQIKDQIRQHNIKTFSSNYALYADLSSRVMRTLERFSPRVEVYSIDEAFLDLTGFGPAVSLLKHGQEVKVI